MTLKIPSKNQSIPRSIVPLLQSGSPLDNPGNPQSSEEQRKQVMGIIDQVLNFLSEEDCGAGETK
jgi:hypothetical protein